MEAPSAIDPRPWYETAFDQLYALLYAHRDDASARREIDQLLQVIQLKPGATAIDIACGAGRHLRAMLDAGLDAMGVDLSAALLAQAATERDLRGRVIRADVRALPLTGRFDVAFNLFTSFGYFDEAGNARALAGMAATLRPGGRLVIDHANAAYLRRTLVPHDEQTVDDITVTSRRWLDAAHMNKQMNIAFADGRTEVINERVRLYEPDEMRSMLAHASIEVDGVFGNFDGSLLTADAPRMICTGVRR